MTDQRLRDLTRRAQASGSVEDAAALLLARVRAGELDEGRVRLAALCGHPAARAALEERAALPEDAEAVAGVLLGFGTEPLAIAVAAITEAELERYAPPAELVEQALPAIRGWLECPCGEHAIAVRQVQAAANACMERLVAEGQFEPAAGAVAARDAATVVLVLAGTLDEPAPRSPRGRESSLDRAVRFLRDRRAGVIERALVEWALA